MEKYRVTVDFRFLPSVSFLVRQEWVDGSDLNALKFRTTESVLSAKYRRTTINSSPIFSSQLIARNQFFIVCANGARGKKKRFPWNPTLPPSLQQSTQLLNLTTPHFHNQLDENKAKMFWHEAASGFTRVSIAALNWLAKIRIYGFLFSHTLSMMIQQELQSDSSNICTVITHSETSYLFNSRISFQPLTIEHQSTLEQTVLFSEWTSLRWCWMLFARLFISILWKPQSG